jgi:hypothetical protein
VNPMVVFKARIAPLIQALCGHAESEHVDSHHNLQSSR